MKKIVTAVLVLLMVMCFAGCGQEEEEANMTQTGDLHYIILDGYETSGDNDGVWCAYTDQDGHLDENGDLARTYTVSVLSEKDYEDVMQYLEGSDMELVTIPLENESVKIDKAWYQDAEGEIWFRVYFKAQDEYGCLDIEIVNASDEEIPLDGYKGDAEKMAEQILDSMYTE